MNEGKTLAEAATCFLASLPSGEREAGQQELNKFVRWCGMERPVCELAALEVANYAGSIEGSSANAMKRAAPVRAFLSYAKKEGLTKSNLAVHLRVKKVSPKQGPVGKGQSEPVTLTAEGYEQLKAELAALKGERPRIAETIRKAAADKDFKENAPLDAAKDEQGMIEARIRHLEATLRSAVVTTEKASSTKVALGSTVILRDLSDGEELRYTLVNPREASPAKGKLSIASPTGKVLLGRGQGEVIAVAAPAGTLRYQIEGVEG